MRSDLRALRERIRQVEAGGHRDTPLRRAYNLVPTIVSLRRIEAGEFVMLDYGVRYNMDAAHCQ